MSKQIFINLIGTLSPYETSKGIYFPILEYFAARSLGETNFTLY